MQFVWNNKGDKMQVNIFTWSKKNGKILKNKCYHYDGMQIYASFPV